jgi:hypothetical protein
VLSNSELKSETSIRRRDSLSYVTGVDMRYDHNDEEIKN